MDGFIKNKYISFFFCKIKNKTLNHTKNVALYTIALIESYDNFPYSTKRTVLNAVNAAINITCQNFRKIKSNFKLFTTKSSRTLFSTTPISQSGCSELCTELCIKESLLDLFRHISNCPYSLKVIYHIIHSSDKIVIRDVSLDLFFFKNKRYTFSRSIETVITKESKSSLSSNADRFSNTLWLTPTFRFSGAFNAIKSSITNRNTSIAQKTINAFFQNFWLEVVYLLILYVLYKKVIV